MIDLSHHQVEIEYPLKWKYKVIILGEDVIDEVLECVKGKDYACHAGNVSSKGKFATYNVEVLVFTEVERLEIHRAFSEHQKTLRVL